MIQEQKFFPSAIAPSQLLQQTDRRRLLYSVCIGLGITVLLILVEVLFISVLNPFHLLGNPANLLALLTTQICWVLPAICIQLICITALVFFAMKPWSIIEYLRKAHTAQEDYHKLYTPLTALTNIRRPREAYQTEFTGPRIFTQDEQISMLDLVQQQDTHQLILGVPGAGKTMALRVYQYLASQQPLRMIISNDKVPVYVPMKNYSLFLKKEQALSSENVPQQAEVSLLRFLHESDLPGMRQLQPYLYSLSQQGRLLLLCDGLNEIDSNYFTQVCEELVQLMRNTRNRLVMTCREVDYREQEAFVQLVEEGQVACATVYPLQPEQVAEFVERYVERQEQQWKHTAGQIMQVIDRSRLRYQCTNPMMLFTLMRIIDKIGVDRGKQIDTRGRLLRESVTQLIAYERQQARWNGNAPQEKEVIRFLSEVACAARWANDRNAIQLRISSLVTGEEVRSMLNFAELADELQFWLDEHPAKGPFVIRSEEEGVEPYEPYSDLALLLQFALSAALIEITPGGVLSFQHELIAEYFVAQYFFAAADKVRSGTVTMREELLENVGRWSEPVAIWAGLMENPLILAERFGSLARSNPAYVLHALTLALVCIGVLWTPPQIGVQRSVMLPPSVEEALAVAVRNKAAREELARIFTRCAEEGGQEVYRSLLPLLMVEGVDELLPLLDCTIVPDVLFAHLQDVVDNVAYEAHVNRLTTILGRFGSVVVDRAAQLALPLPERSIRLRAAAVNILGRTHDERAVAYLIERLSDSEPVIVERATIALYRLGPELTMIRAIEELENLASSPFRARIHYSMLLILGKFMSSSEKHPITGMQYQRMLESVVAVLTSNYQHEPEVQQQARELVIREGRNEEVSAEPGRHPRSQRVVEVLLRYLPSQNDIAVQNVVAVLQEIGSTTTPLLLEQLHQPSELVRARVIEILKTTRDPRALPELLRFIDDPAPFVQQQVTNALINYAPQSISGLIAIVQTHSSEQAAERAMQLLMTIGKTVVVPVMNALPQAVSMRTQLLVEILQQVNDPQAIPALAELLRREQLEPLLAIAIIQALSQFRNIQVVAPLLGCLAQSNALISEQAVDALSQLGDIALERLIEALDGVSDTPVAQRTRRALLGMKPFPGERLLHRLASCSVNQAQQIMMIFRQQGVEAVQVLVKHLQHRDDRVRGYVYQMLDEMPGPIVVPALLDVLPQTALRKVVTTFLLKYPDAAISPLVDLLGEHERGDVAAQILPQFGLRILRPLVSGFDDQRSIAREKAQNVLVTLVRQSEDELAAVRELLQLFNPPPPPRARDLLLSVLTGEFAELSIQILQEGLEDAHLIDDVADAYVRLIRRSALREQVLHTLVQSLYREERRRGAEMALVRIGAAAVPLVSELITNGDASVARVARQILREIGAPTLSFIWTAQSDLKNPERREAAREIFHSMRIETIKDDLVALLVSDKPDQVAMAVSLLLERMREEVALDPSEQVMIPELLRYIQNTTADEANVRILALLLLVGEGAILDHLFFILDESSYHRKQLLYLPLLLGREAQDALLRTFEDHDTSNLLRVEIAGLLGMLGTTDVVVDAAQRLSSYGLSSNKTRVLYPEQLALSLRALGGLLAGGQWNIRKLQEMRMASQEGSPEHELFNVLLGVRYEEQLIQVKKELQTERDTFKKERVTFVARIATDQDRLHKLQEEMEQIKREHGFRGDELEQMRKEKEAMRASVEQLTKERNLFKVQMERALMESQRLQEQNKALIQQVNQGPVKP